MQNSVWWDSDSATKYTFVAHPESNDQGVCWIRAADSLASFDYQLIDDEENNALRILLQKGEFDACYYTLRLVDNLLECIPQSAGSVLKLVYLGLTMQGSQQHLQSGRSIWQ